MTKPQANKAMRKMLFVSVAGKGVDVADESVNVNAKWPVAVAPKSASGYAYVYAT